MRNHPADPAAGGAFSAGAGADADSDAERLAAARRKPIVVGLVGSGEAVRRHAETIIASPVAVIGGLCDVGEHRSAPRRAAPRRDESAFRRRCAPPQSPGRPASAHRFAAASSACVPSGPAACDRPSPSRPSSAVALPPTTAWERMLADVDIELIVLCTPAHTHQRLAAEALFARKAVLLDQPALRSEQQLDQLLALAARRDRPIGAMFPERFRLPDIALLSPWSGRTLASIEVARAAGLLGRRAVRYADVACQIMGNPATVIALDGEQRRVRRPESPAVAVWFESGAMLTVSGVSEPRAGASDAGAGSTANPEVRTVAALDGSITNTYAYADMDTDIDADVDTGAPADRLSVCDAGREMVLSDGAVRFRDHDGVQWYSAESPAALRAAVYVDFHRALRSGGDLDRTALARSRGVIRMLERLDGGTAA